MEGNWDAMVTARGRLAQLVRALPSHGRGHWFESSIAHTDKRDPCVWAVLVSVVIEVPELAASKIKQNEQTYIVTV